MWQEATQEQPEPGSCGMPAWRSPLPGRWVTSHGVVDILQLGEGTKASGRWRGKSGGQAGVEGRLCDNGAVLRGHHFDMDAGLFDRDRLEMRMSVSEVTRQGYVVRVNSLRT